MRAWTYDELDRIATAEELQIAPRRQDDTLRNPVPIWVVRVGDDLYVRSYRGPDGAWYQAAQKSQAGRIQAGGVQKDVVLVAITDSEINDRIDAAYRRKYGRYPQYVPPMLTAAVRTTTLKLLPQPAGNNS